DDTAGESEAERKRRAPAGSGDPTHELKRPDPVELEASSVDATVEAAWETLSSRLNTRRIAFVDALSESRSALDELDPNGNLGEYTRAVVENVIDPVVRAFTGASSARSVLALWDTTQDELRQAAANLPEELARPEPASLYNGHEDDTLLTRIRKTGVRAARGLNRVITWPMTKLSGSPVGERTQTVPLGALGAYHLSVRVPRHLSRVVERGLRELARPTAHLERAFSDWSNRVLQNGFAHVAEPTEDGSAPSISKSPHDELTERVQHALELAREVTPTPAPDLKGASDGFNETLLKAGTFMLDMGPFRPDRVRRVKIPMDERWGEFFDRAENRFALVEGLVHLRLDLQQHLADFEATVRDETASVAGAIRRAGGELEALSPTSNGGFGSSEVDRLRSETDQVVKTLAGRLGGTSARRRIEAAADSLTHSLATATRSLPDVFHCQEIQDATSFVSPAPPRRDYRFKEVAETAFDALAIEQLRVVSLPLTAHFEKAATCATELAGILEFNLGAAKEDLAAEQPSPGDAVELVRGGLKSAAALTQSTAEQLESGVQEEFPAAHEALQASWQRLHGRMRVEDQRQDELIGVWTAFTSWFALRGKNARQWVRQSAKQLKRRATLLQRRLVGLLRRGQKAVLQPQVSDADTERTLVAIQSIEELTKDLPIVYQRLFALSPVSDPDLVVGRAEAIRKVGHMRRRWERGVAPILAVTAPDGVGKSTFLNVLERQVFEDCRTIRVSLVRRLSDPGDFFAQVMEAAGADPAPQGSAPSAEDKTASTQEAPVADLAHTAQTAFSSLESTSEGRPVVVMVEPAEHLFSRRVGGGNVMDGVLTQLRKSPPAVWWILSSSSYAWALLETLEPTASTLARRLELQPLGRKRLEELVMKRHSKSGLPLRFLEPETLSRRLQSEAKRAPTEEARQKIYRHEFFDRLSRLSEGDITLAMFQWLRSLEVDRGDRLLKVNQTSPLSFAFLSELDLDRTFALKSFLDHGSLTPEEHADITGVPLHRSLVLFESLFGLSLIIPRQAGDFDNPTAVEPDERYSLHPLAARPVVDHLIAQRIIH
ncbi:MAG: hypothetical protein ACR2QM_01890, partial [Longimicrobiales bacterium]